MWTPRRIVLLVAGIVLFFSSYLGYARSHIGSIDGLPTLPDEFRKTDEPPPPPPPPRASRLELKLKQAFGFGQDCPELTPQYPIKLELNSRSMALAAGMVRFDDDGRVYLEPVSVALFGKNPTNSTDVEINTVHSKHAWLTFDRPVYSLQDISGRKIIGAKLTGKIEIVNNRHTVEKRTDDLCLFIDQGPLFYDESKHLLWTDDNIYVRDEQSVPKPTEIRGKGMDVELVAEEPAKPGAPPVRKAKSENVSGVKSVTIRSNVEMFLYVDANHSGMPGGASAASKPGAGPAAKKEEVAKKPADAEKSLVVIKTAGRFRYEFEKDHDDATFDVPEQDPKHPPQTPQVVTVDRHQPKLKTADHLICKHLELRLTRKAAAPAGSARPVQPKQPTGANAADDHGLEVEVARATGGPGEVVLMSESPKPEDKGLLATGNEFIHDSRQLLTILRDVPEMYADKDGTIIHAKELRIKDVPLPDGTKEPNGKVKTYQQMTAKGPGRVDLTEKPKPKAPGRVEPADKTTEKITNRAYWTDTLISSRDFDTKGWTRDGPLDLLVLTGSARFVNEVDGSVLQGDTLKVWVMPREPEGNPTTKSQPAEQPAPRPRRVDALGNVSSSSRELIIHDTSQLKVIFKDAPPVALPPLPPTGLPAPTEPAEATGQVATRTTAPPYETAKPTGQVAPPSAPDSASAPATAAGSDPKTKPAPAKPEEPPARPMNLSARTVDATVMRGTDPDTGADKNTLETLWCTGRVHVRQDGDPANPGDKGVDIKGSTLSVEWQPEGNLMIVTADTTSGNANEDDLAQMLVNNIYIIGPQINVDEAKNKVWVDGSGAMMMESGTTLNGIKKENAVPLTVHWTKSMVFIGKSVMYQGEIQAEQENSRLACEALTVFFDRPILIKQKRTDKGAKPTDKTAKQTDKGAQPVAKGAKAADPVEPPPRVETMVCDRKVLIEEATPETDKAGKPVIDKATGRPKLGKYQRISSPSVYMEANEKEPGEVKDTNKMRASGPGKVWLLQRGAVDPLAAPTEADKTKAAPTEKTKAGPKSDEEEVMKLTYIEFGKSMLANNKTGKANFWGGVRALNMPSEDPALEIDLDVMLARLPKDAMYLTSEQLEVFNSPGPDGKSYQQMHATHRVWAKTNEYEATCETLDYDEAKDQTIFRGSENGLATLERTLKKGGRPEVIKGKEIIYHRSTGAFKVDGSPYVGN